MTKLKASIMKCNYCKEFNPKYFNKCKEDRKNAKRHGRGIPVHYKAPCGELLTFGVSG